MSLHIYPKQSRIPLLVHGSIISSLVVHGPGYPSRAYIRDHLEPTSGTISSQHLGPSRDNIWDHLEPTSGIHLEPTSGIHLEPTSGTILRQHLGPSRANICDPSRANIWDHLEPTSGKPSSHLGCPGSREDLVLNKFYLVLPQTKVWWETYAVQAFGPFGPTNPRLSLSKGTWLLLITPPLHHSTMSSLSCWPSNWDWCLLSLLI